jgi:hypothetical protein
MNDVGSGRRITVYHMVNRCNHQPSHPTSVKLLLDFHLTYIELLSNFRLIVLSSWRIVTLTSYRVAVLTYCHINVLSCYHTVIMSSCHFVVPFNLHPTFVRHLSVVVHSFRHTIFFKLYFVFELCNWVLYCYKILGHGTTPCPWMKRAVPLKQSPGISYEITHNPLNRFL